jgi:hypothetical protein
MAAVALRIHRLADRHVRDKLEKAFGWPTIHYRDELEAMVERIHSMKGPSHAHMQLYWWADRDDAYTHGEEYVVETATVNLPTLTIKKTVSSDSDVTRYWIENRTKRREPTAGELYTLVGDAHFSFWVLRTADNVDHIPV